MFALLLNLFLSFFFSFFSFYFQLLIYAIVVLKKLLQTEFVDLHFKLPKPRGQIVIMHALK